VSEPDADQWCLARVPVTSERWLARLLMRLGEDAQVIEPERYVGLASSTAAAVLARYDVR
jgi:predicted DNA-binding transcriptional regulator YafY